MVRLVLFDRKLDIATDDLYFPSAIIAVFRLIWMAALMFTIIIIFSDNCNLPQTVGLYVLLHLILCCFCLFTECCSVYISMSGTVNNETPRRKISYWAHAETLLIVMDLSLQFYGTYVTYNAELINNSLVCSSNSLSIALVKMVVVWAFVCDTVFIFVFGLFVFISKPRKLNSDVQNYLLTWKRRIEWFVTNPEKMDRKGDNQTVIADVAALFARFFKDVDWAPSDMAVGLILLKREQKIMRQVTELRRAHPISSSFWTNLLRSQNLANLEVENANYTARKSYDMSIPSASFPSSSSSFLSDPVLISSANMKTSPDSNSSNLENDLKKQPVGDQDDLILVETPKGIEMLSIRKDASADTLNDATSNNQQSQPHRHSNPSQERNNSTTAPSLAQNFQLFMQSLNLRSSNTHPQNNSTIDDLATGKSRQTSIFDGRGKITDYRRKSEVMERITDFIPPQIPKSRPRSMSFALSSKTTSPKIQQNITSPKSPRQSNDWSFSAYSFNLSPAATEMKRPDILDIIHFSHYANMAYVTLDPEIQKKSDILLHFSPRNHLFQAPYLVSLDHDWNSIVIAIRGTYSISDVLVDLKVDTAVLDVDLADAEEYQVHAGFLKTASNIVDDIIKHDVLGKTLRNDSSREACYQIVVCGHSLGAGLSSIVAYLLRKKGFTMTRCYGYGMPCVGNDRVAKLFSEFCMSIIVGDDLISRLSVHSCDTLKSDVARLLDRCNLPKYKIFASAIANNCISCCGEDPEKRKSLLTRTQNGLFPQGSATSLQECEIVQIVENAARNSNPTIVQRTLSPGATRKHLTSSKFTQFYSPGRILYVEKVRISSPVLSSSLKNCTSPTAENSGPVPKRKRGVASLTAMTQALKERLIIAKYQSFDSKYIYIPRWAQKEEFLDIVVSRTMIRDHTAIFGLLGEFDNMDPSEPLKVLS